MAIPTSVSSSFLLILLLVSSLLSLSLSASSRCHPDDKRALLAIKKSLNPQNFASWNPRTDCCGWDDVICDADDQVVRLYIRYTTMIGSIPAAVGDLRYLEILDFSYINNLTGSIPYSITKLQNLKSLTISRTSVTGPVPEFLSQLKNLESLDLSFNELSGPIPASLADLTKLGYLVLRVNKLTGTIPDSLGRFKSNFTTFDLSHNELSGTIPKSLGGLNFQGIGLSDNNLVGDASMLFRENSDALWYDLSRNQLDFDLSKVRFPKTTSSLDLSHNRIRGSIPKQLTELSVAELDLSYNRLCGEIPIGGNLQTLGSGPFYHNKCLCGSPLPKCK
ncbi:PREDICTED: polygalacturonase inhibitor 2-like [Nelumbo nucifera]|uniref:Leucine-rich repeat-containing N-terminal plant-type domain-containing protein n=2 Tax=Nelumbo nucifera TaxID=4432 RepID=A0A822ZGK4_NELNU|nr:PREDICTED: polygalacturonase inhibitor 2-like [Nelumbo nucifera]DAD43733.1 TPA_asm: hypothetical protein HUJ06_001963 [Nelumbo nucifera]